ncbi:4-oxalomesaconate tautomerase [Aestuariibius sp. 2305UL40-4]|uniref:4-oxalomesaconate tautomerase n=1 Tax=Aestuariibius violaceus TaxID=3234132 RepID=UPI00345EE8A5
MTQRAIPFLFLRGGTSRGPYFRRSDLPKDRETLSRVLIEVTGSGHPLNIDGLGGGAAVTTKVAMLSASEDDWADIDYLFAQVSVTDRLVDFGPTCGNILSGVGPAALEMGLIVPQGEVTEVKIRAVNTGARVIATVQTPGGTPTYEGGTAIDGVSGTAAPVELAFMEVEGSSTGALLPTGKSIDLIDGIEVTCMDVAMPIVITKAEAFGLTGYETREELDENRTFFDRIEKVRLAAGPMMGLGDVTKSVTPKFAILAKPRQGGAIAARYFMPWACHPTMAVTGAQCLATCAMTPATVADGLANRPSGPPATVTIEHPTGAIDVILDYEPTGTGIRVKSAGLLRTARKIAAGEVFVSSATWPT